MDLNADVRGSWWLPSSPESTVHGILATIDEAMILDLVDSLTGAVAPNFSGDEILQIVHGTSASGDAVTLLECRRTDWSMTSAGTNPEKWYVGAVVIGRHMNSADEVVSSVKFWLGPLLSWAGDPAGVEIVPPSDPADGIVLRSREHTLGSSNIDGDTISLHIGHTYELGPDSASIGRHAFLAIEPLRPTSSIRELIDDYALAFRDLLAITTRGYTSVDRVSFTLQDDTGNNRWMPATYLARLLRPMKSTPGDSDTTILDMAGLRIPFEHVVPAWLDLRRLHLNTVNMLVAPTFAPHTFTDTLLLTAWLAVEGYHETAMKHTGEAADEASREHHARVDAIVAAAPDEFKDWANQQLRDKNAIGQRLKLEQVMTRAGKTGQAVIRRNPNFVKNAVAGRRRVAHPATYAGNSGAQFLFLANTLRWLVIHCLLVDLGVPETDVTTVITRDRHFQFDIASVASHHSKP